MIFKMAAHNRLILLSVMVMEIQCPQVKRYQSKLIKEILRFPEILDVTMLDTQSKAFTMFSFIAIDSKPDTTQLQQAIIDISTSGPNGEKKISIYGTSR